MNMDTSTRVERWLQAHERQWRWVLQAIAWVTIVTGAAMIVMPGTMLASLRAGTDLTSRHTFGIEGMFMILFGGLLLQGLMRPRENGVPLLWAGIQKLAAFLAVSLGVLRGVFSPLALTVAFFDLLSGVLVLGYRAFLSREQRAAVAGNAGRLTANGAVMAPLGMSAPGVVVPLSARPRPPVVSAASTEEAHASDASPPAPGMSVAETADLRASEPARPLLPLIASGRKRSLILAGGGMRVAWQAGVLRALADAGLTFQHGDGTSGGIINLAMLLSGESPKEMCDRWRTLRVKDFVSFVSPEKYLRAWDMEAMGDADGIVQHVFPHLGIDVDAIRANASMEGTFNVCDFTRKTNDVIPHTRVERDFLVAGISLPIFMPPVRRDGGIYTDSVWIQDANLLEAVHRGADELWVMWCIGNTPVYERGFFRQYVHMIEMSANGALFSQLEQIQSINDRIRAGEVVLGHREPITVHLIKPERPLPLDPDFYAGHITAASLIDMGYSDAWRYLAVASDRGLPLTPEMTQMTEPAPDLTFRETMSGPLALGVTDPMAGAQQGRATPFTMHCTISVDDMDAFEKDANHAARLVAHVSFPPFGEDISVREGAFNLFRNTDDPNTRLMTYSLRFEANGKEYVLEGTKTIHDDRGPDLWKDTTRLYSQLHEGPDARGPVVGAGVLTLGVGQLLKLIASMRSAREGLKGVEMVGRFGKLFLGTLWEIYAPHAKAAPPQRTPEESKGGESTTAGV
ncbi:patatin-like phospholipase family protein [Pyxidicoccus parkwayensis]|uniref:Patatin-like phospholipase family protein n=1 Tax=Pyxidicoccus parkwayensis TaxID=2813578 RepID=A0ABX7NVV0_9BACT|nr:patatin-like phospholipase family protein [Pyxidicoccus parkwaysis]QSQ22536.1 patatin-like phospholipase family protein [Pyxidicoccus parkwaysis]